MSRFYGSLKGGRGEATKGGSKTSGIEGHIRGWWLGARVTCFVGGAGEDRVKIELTGGSANHQTQLVGIWRLVNGKPVREGKE